MFTDSVAVAVGTGCHHYPAVTSIPLTPIRGTRMRSDSGSRIRFAEAFGKGGIVVGLGVVERPARVATPRLQASRRVALGFPGSLSCRLRQLLARQMLDVFPRFHFVASRLRWLRRRLGRFAARSALGTGGGIVFAMGELAVFVDWRGLQGNFHVPTPFARRLHDGDVR